MAITVHHSPANTALLWNMHVWQSAWDGNNVWDFKATPNGLLVDFQLPDVADPRLLQFKFYSTDPATGQVTWEADDFVRRLFLKTPSEVWTFESSARVIYQNPAAQGVAFHAGDVLTFQVITQKAFRGGQIYVWSPYDASAAALYFPESARDDANDISTFRVTLAPWMTAGFNLKLMQPAANNQAAVWEPDASNRVWRGCDGSSLWLKSGQCNVRSKALALTNAPLQVLYGANLVAVPQFTLTDLVEGSTYAIAPSSTQPYGGSALFQVATYNVPIYPGTSYAIASAGRLENPPIQRPFPADPTAIGKVSQGVLGASAWVNSFPTIVTVPLSIQPLAVSSFGNGVSVQVSLGNGPVYQTVAAGRQQNGTWQAALPLPLDTTIAIDLSPAVGSEPKPYDWIDTSRYFTATAATSSLYTTEGVYGVCSTRGTTFAEPPLSRPSLMQAAFGSAVVKSGIFAVREMPAGATLSGGSVYFVVHAPHAVCASLILVNETAVGGPTRQTFSMSLTADTFYWWCSIPAAQAPPGNRYRFLLNDNIEVIDPAARAVQDGGSLGTSFGDDPKDASTSWSMILDVAAVYAAAHTQPWQTMGWQEFLIYEVHAQRFTNLQPGALTPLDLLADELNPVSRLGQPGYLRELPVTILGLMPVNEFSSTASWGYDPSFYFAIDGFYGGAAALARFVNAAHVSGRGVTLDVVYNHSLGSSLMAIAPDVYRNGDYDGDRMNCGHPMVGEYFRQASVYLLRTFNLDGFRFDDTNTIVTKCAGGWEFLGMIRWALRAAAAAEGRAWPYCVAENSASNPWDISDPSWGVLDGQWDIDEVFRIRDASYDSWHAGWDDSLPLESEMNKPAYWGRPFYQATRFGESHDMVSGQDAQSVRIAARPPFGQGYQMAKALGTLTLLSNGIPMLFMGQEIGETVAFSFSNYQQWINPQLVDLAPAAATDQTRILAWFRQLIGLRDDPSQGLQGDANYQLVATGNRTVAFVCGSNQQLFVVVTFGTPNQLQDSSWLGLPPGIAYKEIFNSSWPAFRVVLEPQRSNGGYSARIYSGQILNLPFIGAVVLQRC
jgi:1,4-alpha-glucan branching enzyme